MGMPSGRVSRPFLALLFFGTFMFPGLAYAAGCGAGVLGTNRTISVGTSGGLHVGLKSYPQTIALANKEVVLTFDDGPLPSTTNRVLNALKKECVKATFFLIGRNARANPQIVRRQIAEGHSVGHHTWSHPSRTLRGMSPPAAVKEIVRGIAAVEMAAYGRTYTGGKPRVPFFRFPGFADTAKTKSWLDSNGIATFGTDLWASDWLSMTPGAQLGVIMRRLNRTGRGIILFHDTRSATAAMLPGFLRALKAGGYRVVHLVPGSFGQPALRRAPSGWRSQTQSILRHFHPHRRSAR